MLKNLFVIFLIILPYFLFSQNRISIPSKSIERSRIDTINIEGTLSLQNSSTLRIKLLFDAHFIDVKKVIGNPNFVIIENEPYFSLDLTKIDSAVINVQATNFQSIVNGIIFQVLVEGLVYKDSVTYIFPIEVAIDDSLIECRKDTGTIIVRGPSVFPIEITSIGFAYPLPVQSHIYFNFSLGKRNEVNFSIFSINGKQVLSSINNPENFIIVEGLLNKPVYNSLLEGGNYLLRIEIPDKISSGVYFLRMNTSEFGPFYSKFMLLK